MQPRGKAPKSTGQPAQARLQNIAAGNGTYTDLEFAVDASTDSQAFHVFSNQGQCGIGGESVWLLVDNIAGHVRVHRLGEQYIEANLLTSKEKSTYFDHFLRIQDIVGPYYCHLPDGAKGTQHQQINCQ